MNSVPRRSPTSTRFVRSIASAGPREALSALCMTGRANAMSSAASSPLPVTSATTMRQRPSPPRQPEQLEEVAADVTRGGVMARQVVARHVRRVERDDAALLPAALGQLGRVDTRAPRPSARDAMECAQWPVRGRVSRPLSAASSPSATRWPRSRRGSPGRRAGASGRPGARRGSRRPRPRPRPASAPSPAPADPRGSRRPRRGSTGDVRPGPPRTARGSARAGRGRAVPARTASGHGRLRSARREGGGAIRVGRDERRRGPCGRAPSGRRPARRTTGGSVLTRPHRPPAGRREAPPSPARCRAAASPRISRIAAWTRDEPGARDERQAGRGPGAGCGCRAS